MKEKRIFQYGDTEIAYLTAKDRVLGAAIQQIGPIQREVMPDLFEALVNAIVGQQISTKAQRTVWQRFVDTFGHVTPQALLDYGPEKIQALGISSRKAGYILNAAQQVQSGALDLDVLCRQEEEAVCRALTALPGIGVWTAEMLMLFSMQRPNVFSFDDFALKRGLRMLYRHRTIDRDRFERFRRRYTPYASVASLYLWEIAGGALPALSDPAPKKGK